MQNLRYRKTITNGHVDDLMHIEVKMWWDRMIKKIMRKGLLSVIMLMLALLCIDADDLEIITIDNEAFSSLMDSSARNLDVSQFTAQNMSEIIGFNGFVSYIDPNGGILITGLKSDGSDSFLKFYTLVVYGENDELMTVQVGDYGIFYGSISENQSIRDTIAMDIAIFESIGNDSTVSLSDNYELQEIAAEVQKALNDSGYDCGSPDGKIGPKTEAAISSYRTSHGLSEGGIVDAGLIAALGLSGTVHDIQDSITSTAVTKSVPVGDQFNSDETTPVVSQDQQTFICNTNTKKFHYPSCSSVRDMKEKNKWEVTASASEIIGMGYDPCKRCNPH